MADQGLFAFFSLIKYNYIVENRPIKKENIIISHRKWLLRLELAFFSFPNLYSFDQPLFQTVGDGSRESKHT